MTDTPRSGAGPAVTRLDNRFIQSHPGMECTVTADTPVDVIEKLPGAILGTTMKTPTPASRASNPGSSAISATR